MADNIVKGTLSEQQREAERLNKIVAMISKSKKALSSERYNLKTDKKEILSAKKNLSQARQQIINVLVRLDRSMEAQRKAKSR